MSFEPPDVTGPAADQFGRTILQRIKSAAADRGAKPRAKYSKPRTDATGNVITRDPMLLGDSLQTLVNTHGWRDQLSVAAVIGRWRSIVGDQIADHCEPLEFSDGTLVVRASSTAWASQLNLLTGQMLAAFAREVGEDVVADIKVLGPSTRSFKRGAKSVPGRGPRDTWG
ncbi:Predicted nucleic acid-binding protein, contains Zn-ribbon domain (includes truncated derivatives) [Micrococcales bacterium KH10]|nr:Predicted nucleic acid-binding protein, contains Zn-ribbon domain (includes truncated derivatives) [Micrococcales bacterium KH10]